MKARIKIEVEVLVDVEAGKPSAQQIKRSVEDLLCFGPNFFTSCNGRDERVAITSEIKKVKFPPLSKADRKKIGI